MDTAQERFNPRQAFAILALVMAALVAASPAMAETVYLEFDNNGLENLGPNFVYEGWLIVDGMPVSTGTFTIDSAGMAIPNRFAVDLGQASNFGEIEIEWTAGRHLEPDLAEDLLRLVQDSPDHLVAEHVQGRTHRPIL